MSRSLPPDPGDWHYPPIMDGRVYCPYCALQIYFKGPAEERIGFCTYCDLEWKAHKLEEGSIALEPLRGIMRELPVWQGADAPVCVEQVGQVALRVQAEELWREIEWVRYVHPDKWRNEERCTVIEHIVSFLGRKRE